MFTADTRQEDNIETRSDPKSQLRHYITIKDSQNAYFHARSVDMHACMLPNPYSRLKGHTKRRANAKCSFYA